MFRKTISLGKSETAHPRAHIATESYWFLGVLIYRRDVLEILP